MSSDGLPNMEPCYSPLGQLVGLPGGGCWPEVLLWDNSSNQIWKHGQATSPESAWPLLL